MRTSSLESFVFGGTAGRHFCKLWKALRRLFTLYLSLAALRDIPKEFFSEIEQNKDELKKKMRLNKCTLYMSSGI